MKQFYTAIGLLISMTFLFGMLLKHNIHDSGVANISTIEHIQSLDCKLTFPIGITEDDEQYYYNYFFDNKDDWVESGINSSVILIGKPTNMLIQSSRSLGQGIEVINVIKGHKNLVGEEIMIYGVDGFNVEGYNLEGMEGNPKTNRSYYQPIYNAPMNVMKPDHEYLLLLNESELNHYQKQKAFNPAMVFFSYLDLTSDYSDIIPSNQEDDKLNDYFDSEFFVKSERIRSVMYDIKHEIIDSVYSK